MCCRMSRIGGQRPVVGGQGFRPARLLLQHQPKISQCRRIGGAEPNRLAKRRFGICQPSLGAQGTAKVAQRLGILRLRCQRLPIRIFGCYRVAAGQPQVAQRVECLGLRGSSASARASA